jgi:iron-sulfur cluster assembly accessory protein
MSVDVTASAAHKIAQLCDSEKYVRLAINAGGCQGYNKVWEIVDSIDGEDIVITCGDNGKLLIDPISLEIIHGAKIDYKLDLSGSYFVIDVPSATSTCGCGSSFSI